MIGLGKMGLSLTKNLTRNGVYVVGYDNMAAIDQDEINQLFIQAGSLSALIDSLPTPRVIWLMVPAGDITRSVIEELKTHLSEGDIVIDGGNSFYKNSVENYNDLAQCGISFLDCGTSGGVNGALNGGNFMIGGDKEVFDVVEPIFKKIACENGYLYTGKPGSGHYLKMVHNGIEYGMMAAIGEGFDLLEHSQYDYDNEKVAKLWNNGSVIRSWLIELIEEAFKEDPKLEKIKGIMYSSGEGKWTVEEALDLQVSIPVITTSLMMRYRSLEEDTFTGKVVASLRNGFGGHVVKKN
ncbi:phosphogluconate dehydrogenase (NAD(+)-dependent, decarboxylating) [Alkalibaculum bacchi]|nr:decarboxylating 6-phosphogluconate dehydrogenase [Alkalibaculum bacchi]